MEKHLQKIETWLRIDSLNRTSDKLRARAVYMIASLLIVSQVVNMMLMTLSYGSWTFDHWISLIASTMILGSIFGLRYTKRFYLFASFYSLLMVLGIFGSAVHDFTGINSALLPFMLFGSIVCGFISGWRMVLAYGAIVGVTVFVLYQVSVGAPTGALFDPALFAARNFQRAAQMYIGLGLVTAIAGFVSYSMHSAFYELEKNAGIALQASQDKTQFMANMSHELRTPLNGVIGMSDLILKMRQEPQQKQYTQIINDCAQNLFAIIKDVLDVTKIDADSYRVAHEELNLPRLLQSIVELNKPAASARGLTIGLHYPENLPKKFMGDPKSMRQVINNLMSNAIKFTEKGSAYICVDGVAKGADAYQLNISVKDTGIGIAAKDIETIFKRFSQLDTRLSRAQEGTGLGLSLSKKISELIGGKLSVLTRPDEGSTFTLEIEMAVPNSAPKSSQMSGAMSVRDNEQENGSCDKPDISYFQPADEPNPTEFETEFEEVLPFGEERGVG